MLNPNNTENIKDCDAAKIGAFILTIEKSGEFERKAYFPVDEKSHFERFNYVEKQTRGKVSIVYDTKAKMLSVTAEPQLSAKLRKWYESGFTPAPVNLIPDMSAASQSRETAEKIQFKKPEANQNEIKASFNAHRMQDKPAQKPESNTVQSVTAPQRIEQSAQPNSADKQNSETQKYLNQPQQNNNQPQKNDKQPQQNNSQPQKKDKLPQKNNKQSHQNNKQPQQKNADPAPASQPVRQDTPPQQNAVSQKKQNQAKNNKQSQKKQEPQSNAKAETLAEETANLEYKNGFIVKNYTPERFAGVLTLLKSINGVTLKKEKSAGQSRDIQAYKIEDAKKQKLYVRYNQNKQAVQLQGKESALFTDMQAAFSEGADYKTAVSSYIKQSGEDVTTSEIEKKLKKLIPAAFEFLSEQSKKDLTFALIDIYNEETKLSDYSALMVSPYRGLERLIYDLQTAQGINVKMIGQAFEKQAGGNYCLKGGYRRKIQSNVYNTVLSALYTEYFEKRNFYLHSDNSTLGSQRVIREKDEAKKIFDNLLEIINYYCFMLKEIGFTVSKGK